MRGASVHHGSVRRFWSRSARSECASTHVVGTAILLAAGLAVAAVATQALATPNATEARSTSARLTAVADAHGAQVRLLHGGAATLDAGSLGARIVSGEQILYDGPLAPKDTRWAPGAPLTIALAAPIPGGATFDVSVTERGSGSLVGATRMRLPPPAAPLVPPAGFAIEANVDGSAAHSYVNPAQLIDLDVSLTHPWGRKYVRYVYADLSALGGSSWIDLPDDGTAWDRTPGDGVHMVRLAIPPHAPSGTFEIGVNAVDLLGGRATRTVDLTIMRDALTILDPTASRALDVSGNGCLRAVGDVFVNSSSSSAISASGTGCSALERQSVVATGKIRTVGASSGGCCSPAPIAATPRPDPYADLPLPRYSGGVWTVDGVALPARSGPAPGNILKPGVYAGGVSLSGGAWTMEPGVYVMDAGRFSVSGSNIVRGDGVFIYLAGSSSPCRGLSLSGTATLDLSPPTDGTYAGILFAQQRDCPAASSMSGGSGLQVEGTIYLPAGDLTLSGSSVMSTLKTHLVVDTLKITGGGFSLVRL